MKLSNNNNNKKTYLGSTLRRPLGCFPLKETEHDTKLTRDWVSNLMPDSSVLF